MCCMEPKNAKSTFSNAELSVASEFLHLLSNTQTQFKAFSIKNSRLIQSPWATIYQHIVSIEKSVLKPTVNILVIKRGCCQLLICFHQTFDRFQVTNNFSRRSSRFQKKFKGFYSVKKFEGFHVQTWIQGQCAGTLQPQAFRQQE